MPTRRAALKALSAVSFSGISGCLRGAADGHEETTHTTTAVEEFNFGEWAQVSGGKVTVENVAVQRFVQKDIKSDSPNTKIVAEEQTKYLTATLRERNQPAVTAFLRADGNRVERGRGLLYDGYNVSPHKSRIYFPLDLRRTIDSGAVVFAPEEGMPVASWALPESALFQLNHPPAFEVHQFSAPAEVAEHRDIPVTITVENTGQTDGVFRANLGIADLSHPPTIQIEVPAGEKRTVEKPVPVYQGGELTVVLNWGSNRLTETVTVPPSDSDSGNES